MEEVADVDVFVSLDMSDLLNESGAYRTGSELFDELMQGCDSGLYSVDPLSGDKNVEESSPVGRPSDLSFGNYDLAMLKNILSVEVPETNLEKDMPTVMSPVSMAKSDSSSTSTIPSVGPLQPSMTATPTKRNANFRDRVMKPKIHGCNLCSSTFTARFNLNKHVRTVHENLRPFHCDVCGASFQQKCHLKQHKTTVHEHKRPYKCEICSQSFGWPAVLNKHIRLKHEKQRPYSCSYCKDVFHQKTQLAHHVDAFHKEINAL